MADNTFINSNPWLPNDLWANIASLLDNEDLAKFRQVCKVAQFIGSHDVILQPLYNRLYAIDKTLPALLPKEGAVLAFKQAFEKIQTNQKAEIAYLTEHHPFLMATEEYTQVVQENTAVSLQSLEAKNKAIDKINSGIIQAKIDVNSTQLDLSFAHITRLPVSLFQAEGYINFWKNLTNLDCSHNQLTTLNVQGLAALQELICYNNQLTSLNVQGLVALQRLYCHDNQLTSLNVQGLAALSDLDCCVPPPALLDIDRGLNIMIGLGLLTSTLPLALSAIELKKRAPNPNPTNPLTDLNLTGVHPDTKNKYAELERSLLFKQLSQADSDEARQGIIARLGVDYTRENCLYYCPVYATKLFAIDSAKGAYSLASSALSNVAAYLPSFGVNNSPEKADLKRKRDEEDAMRIDGQPEEFGNEPDLKRVKKS